MISVHYELSIEPIQQIKESEKFPGQSKGENRKGNTPEGSRPCSNRKTKISPPHLHTSDSILKTAFLKPQICPTQTSARLPLGASGSLKPFKRTRMEPGQILAEHPRPPSLLRQHAVSRFLLSPVSPIASTKFGCGWGSKFNPKLWIKLWSSLQRNQN